MFPLCLPGTLLAFTFSAIVLAQNCNTRCQSFGIDFKDGGAYFQNVNSTDQFTAFETFEGCQNDYAHNVLVSPSGDQYQCSNTQMQPSDKEQLVSCLVEKYQLTSGNWSIIVLSNNGQCTPVNLIRQFSLSVGPQATNRIAATTTVTTISTPVSVKITTISATVTSSASPVVKTVSGTAPAQTVTTSDGLKITIVTKGVATITSTSTIREVVATETTTTTINCELRPKQHQIDDQNSRFNNVLVPDRVNSKIVVTVGSFTQAAVQPTAEPKPGGAGKMRIIRDRDSSKGRRQIIQIRSLVKRHPDQPTTTVVDSGLPPVTITKTSVAPTATSSATSTKFLTSTVTPTLTVTSGQPVVTVTVPGKTITNYFWIPFEKTTVISTSPITAIVTSTTCA